MQIYLTFHSVLTNVCRRNHRFRSYHDRTRNDLQLLLPPRTSYCVYAIGWLFITLCFYLINLHGLKFSRNLELAWVIASVVGVLQELLIQQTLSVAFQSAFRQLFVTSVAKTLVSVDANGMALVGDPSHPQVSNI